MPILNRRRDTNIPTSHRQGKNNRAFYRSRQWTNLSLQHRKRNPLCVECLKEGKTKVGDCVDHKTPITQGGSQTDPNNLQTLCNSHHSIKSKNERKSNNK